MATVARCKRCDWSFRSRTGRVWEFERAIENHEAADCDRGPGVALASRVTSLRMALELARSRGRMWLASPAYDPARNATRVVREMVGYLEDALD